MAPAWKTHNLKTTHSLRPVVSFLDNFRIPSREPSNSKLFMSLAAFPLAPALTEAFNAKVARALKVGIASETFVLEQQFPANAGAEAADFAAIKATLTATQPCYVLFRSDAGEWALMAYVPDDGPVKQKMLYSSAKATLLRELGGSEQLPKEVHWSSLDEVALAEEQSATARAAELESAMTAVEKLKVEGARLEAIEAAGEKMSSVVGLSFPMTEPAKAGLSAFVAGTTGVLLLAIDKETIVCKASAPAGTPQDVAALLPAAEPCYCLYRWKHDREGVSATAVLFAYFCPDEAPVRLKMLHASTKGAMLQSLPSLGVEVTKSIEGLEVSELTDAELMTLVYGTQREVAATITKAAPKGGRRLIKKKSSEDTAVDLE